MRKRTFFICLINFVTLLCANLFVACGDDDNQVPSANPGPAQTVPPGTKVELDGSNSTDPDNDALTYNWKFTKTPENSTAELDNPKSKKTSFIADLEGEYIVQLIVNDGKVDSPPKTVTITASKLPVADAGEDLEVFVDVEVELDGSKSTPATPGNTLTYAWSISKAAPDSTDATLTGETTAKPKFKADKAGEYEIQLIVTEDGNESKPDTVLLTAVEGPIAHAGQDREVVIGNEVELDGSRSQAFQGRNLTYAWSISKAAPDSTDATLTGETTVTPKFTADKEGEYEIQLIVNDGVNDSDPATVKLTAQKKPIADAGQDQEITVDAEIELDGSKSQVRPDKTLTYTWSISKKPQESTEAKLTEETTVTPKFTADKEGEYEIQLIVNDGELESDPAIVKLTAKAAGS
jgi:hypothetical protein